jgi:hypothetical protein
MLRYSLRATLLICTLVLFGFLQPIHLYENCKEEGYKNANFHEYFLYTGNEASSFTKEVEIITEHPLSYFKRSKLKSRSSSGFVTTIHKKGEVNRIKSKKRIDCNIYLTRKKI